MLFIRSATRVKSIRQMLRDNNWEPLAFCTWHCACKKHKTYDKGHQSIALAFCMQCYACKKYKIDVKGRQSGVPYFLYVVVH
jgi:hypothetical protein